MRFYEQRLWRTVFMDVTPCSLVGQVSTFWRNILPPSSGSENRTLGGSRILQNVSNYIWIYTVLYTCTNNAVRISQPQKGTPYLEFNNNKQQHMTFITCWGKLLYLLLRLDEIGLKLKINNNNYNNKWADISCIVPQMVWMDY